MLNSMIFAVALNVCPAPYIHNSTKVWNNIDKRQLKFSKQRCRSLYKYSPCLKFFWKAEEHTYRVICGRSK